MYHLIKAGWKKSSEDLAGSKRFWQRSPAGVALFNAVENELKKHAKGHILDAGAGTLTWKPFIAKYGTDYTSIDFTQTHPDLSVVGSIEDMPLPENSFDTVVSIQVLEHVPHPWLAMKEFNRVLKPGGIAIVSVPHFSYLHNEPYDFWRYTNHGLRTLLSDAGFEIISIQPIVGLLSFLQHSIATIVIGLTYNIPIMNSLCLALVKITNPIAIFLDSLLDPKHLFALKYVAVGKKR